MKHHLAIHLAINDPSNGMATTHCCAVEVGYGFIELAASFHCVIDDEKKSVLIRRRKFPFVGYESWTGNWCWDAVYVTYDVAADMLNYIRTFKGTDFEAGEDQYWEKWASRELFVAADFTDNTSELARIEREHQIKAGQLELPLGGVAW